MLPRNVRRRKEAALAESVQYCGDEARLYLAQNVVLSHFHKMHCFQRLAPSLRLVNHSWRKAVDNSIASLHLWTDGSFEDDTRLPTLHRFKNLTSLSLHKSSISDRPDHLYAVAHMSQLKSLSLHGLSYLDKDLLNTVWRMRFLRDLKLEMHTAFENTGLDEVEDVGHLKSFVICSEYRYPSRIDPGVWKKFGGLEALSIEMAADCASVALQAIRDLDSLQYLRISAPLFPLDLPMICSMHQLNALILLSPIFLTSPQSCVSQLTQLTRLEMAVCFAQLPLWLQHFEKLQCLCLTWECSERPGTLFPEILPPTLTCLTLHNFRAPLKKAVFNPLTSLKKLSLTYTCWNDGDKDDRNAFQCLTNLSEVFIRLTITARRPPLPLPLLPLIHHMRCLRSLFLETSSGIDSRDIAQFAQTLKLQHLTIGSDLDDDDLSCLSKMTSLQSLTLLHCARWTRAGFFSLRTLKNLKDLSLYHCGNVPMILAELRELMECFESLEHIGMFPVDLNHANPLPMYIGNDSRWLRIDESCRVNVYFDGCGVSIVYP